MGEPQQGRLVAIVASVRELRTMGATAITVSDGDLRVSVDFAAVPVARAESHPNETVEEKAAREKREHEETLFYSVPP